MTACSHLRLKITAAGSYEIQQCADCLDIIYVKHTYIRLSDMRKLPEFGTVPPTVGDTT